MLSPSWLRPTFHSFSTMKWVVDQYLDYYKNEENIFLNMMFHSVEGLAQGPYTRNEAEAQAFCRRLEDILIYLRTLNVHSITLSETHNLMNK